MTAVVVLLRGPPVWQTRWYNFYNGRRAVGSVEISRGKRITGKALIRLLAGAIRYITISRRRRLPDLATPLADPRKLRRQIEERARPRATPKGRARKERRETRKIFSQRKYETTPRSTVREAEHAVEKEWGIKEVFIKS